MIILGIDPGTATTGWGIINTRQTEEGKQKKVNRAGTANGHNLTLIDFGCIMTRSTDKMGERLVILRKSLDKIIKTHRPDCMVIERLFFGANSSSALSVGQARGVVLLSAQENKLAIFEYTGLQVKLQVANHGRADKGSIQTAVRRYLKVNRLPKPKDQSGKSVFSFRDDAYDAVATAICHVLKTESSKQ